MTTTEVQTGTPSDDAPLDVMVVEDDPLFQELLAQSVHELDRPTRLHPCADGRAALALVELPEARFDVALVDLGLPDMDGLAVIAALNRRFPSLPILVVSMSSEEGRVLEAIRAGAIGYVLKGDSYLSITRAIEQTLSGLHPISPTLAGYLFRLASPASPPASPAHQGPGLTERELELLRLLADGKTYIQAAVAMEVALSTVQTHIRNLYRKLGVRTQLQAVMKAKSSHLL